jgi:hypothetical protein
MRWRKITEQEVVSALQSPDFTEPSEAKINVWKKLVDRYLRVTYTEDTETITIITAVKKKKGWR